MSGRGAILFFDDVGLELRVYERVGDRLREVYSRRSDLRV